MTYGYMGKGIFALKVRSFKEKTREVTKTT
jgi:hypothetical protein